jgi:hypothetical protein
MGLFDLKQTIVNTITASAEDIYIFFAIHPSLYSGSTLSAENLIADNLHKIGAYTVNTDTKTMSWSDLFSAWLIEEGGTTFNFGPDDLTTQDIKQEPGVAQARGAVKAQIAQGTFTGYNKLWSYGVNQFINSFSAYHTAITESFVGSYNVKVAKLEDGKLQFTVDNDTDWESGTRLRKAASPNGSHQGIIPSRTRNDPGIHLGGTIHETWTWTEPCDK